MTLRQKDKQLLAAVVAGDHLAIKQSMEKRADPNVLDENKTPVLQLIIQSTKLSLSQTCNLIDLLIEQGADVNCVDKSGKTVLDHARRFPTEQALKMVQLLQKNGAVDPKHETKYFTYENNKYTSHARPNNQSTPEVQKKIANRLTRYVDEHQLKMTDLQKLFTREVHANEKLKKGCKLKDNKIDIAHNIAGAKLSEVITAKLNTVPNARDDQKFTEFAEDILSTDDESGKKEANRIYHSLSEPTIAPTDKLRDATKLLEHMNRASRNLIPGHSGPNRALQENRDAHLMIDRNRQLVETPISKKLSESINTLFGNAYNRRSRTIRGRTEYQSSSVHSDKNRSWYQG